MAEFAQLLFNGIVSGSVIAMAAVGLSMIFGILKVVNYAHGDLLTVGAYIAVTLNVGMGWPLIAAALVAMVSVAVLVLLFDYVLFRPMRERGASLLSKLFIAVGLALIIRNSVLLAAGAAPRRFAIDVFRVYTVGPLRITASQLAAIATAAVVLPTLGLILARTQVGKNMRAISDNFDLASVSGVNMRRTIAFTWVLSGSLAAIAGILQGLVQTSFDPNFGFFLLLVIFASVILGGVGSAYGALMAGVVLGVIMDLATWSALFGGVPTVYKPVIAFAVLVLLLIFRPTGLLGKARVM
jgi:neutral amino acid transport system permease protein